MWEVGKTRNTRDKHLYRTRRDLGMHCGKSVTQVTLETNTY